MGFFKALLSAWQRCQRRSEQPSQVPVAQRDGASLTDQASARRKMFRGTAMGFYFWACKFESSVAYANAAVRASLAWTVEHETQDAFTRITAPHLTTGVQAVTEKTTIVVIALSSLKKGGSFEVVRGRGAGNCYVVWRRPHRYSDPCTTGRACGLLIDILSPGRVALKKTPGEQAESSKSCRECTCQERTQLKLS